MATAKKQSASRALATWDEELAKQAQVAQAMEESTATGSFFSLKSGVLSFNDSPVPGNEMAVVIVDSILENVYYEGAYDSDNITGPTCFAFGRDEKTLAPHAKVIEVKQEMCGASGLCNGCEMNEWGSAEKGRGKACRNTRRLALVSAGSFDNGKFKAYKEDQIEQAQLAFLKLPVTSVKGYAAFVKQVAGALKRPPHGIFTKIKVVPDAGTQFKVTFEALGNVPDDLMSVVMARHKEAVASIEQPYSMEPPEEKPKRGNKASPPTNRGRAAPAKGGKARY